MDPLSAIGAAGSVVGILHTVGEALFKLYEIKQKLRESDVIVATLIGELEASRAALQQIKDFLDQDLPSIQVRLDLDATIESCQIMIQFIQTKVSSINLNDPSLKDRLRVVLEDKHTEGYLTKLNRHITALGVMISILQCRDNSRQSQMLSDASNRKLLHQVKEDSTSLIVLYDDTSSITQKSTTTTSSSKFSLRFPFDPQLLSTQPYERAFRNLLRRFDISKSPGTNISFSGNQFVRSENINGDNDAVGALRSLSSSATNSAHAENRPRWLPWNRRSIPSNYRIIGLARPDAIYAVEAKEPIAEFSWS